MPQRNELIVLLLICCAVFVWSGVSPRDPLTWALETFPVYLGVPLLLVTFRRFPFTALTYRLILLHAVVLMIGGHYTYAEMPAGLWVKNLLDLSRNHYDRLGHLMQGAVPAMIVRELLLRTSPLRPGKWLFTLVTATCLAISACYELIEWAGALVFGQGADAFLGTQGDAWDTQWDMLMALVGALLAQLALGRVQEKALERIRSVQSHAREVK